MGELRRRFGYGLGGAVLAAGSLVSAGAGVATAATPCVTSGATTVCSYGYTGGEQRFTVPAGVSSVRVVAVGAAGGADYGGNPGGQGAQVTGTLGGLSGGQVLYVEVGQQPDTASTSEGDTPTAFNGGGAPGFGNASGGGGGASDVRAVSSTAAGSLASRLIVAGGGGGHSASDEATVPAANAGEDAQPAAATAAGGQGGFAGTQTAGGGRRPGRYRQPGTPLCERTFGVAGLAGPGR